jgi:peptide chain release factor 1
VIATHKPTGLSVRCEGERSQHRNKDLAIQLLSARLAQAAQQAAQHNVNAKRKAQVGSGMRGDKRRTVALQRGTVVDHKLGKKLRSKEYLRGMLDPLYRS